MSRELSHVVAKVLSALRTSVGSEREEGLVAELLDGVELRVASGRWPAGTVGTVVDKLRDGALLVEVTDDGRTLDTVVVHPSAVRPLATFEQERLAV